MKYGNGSLPLYFDYGFAEGFYLAGVANPAERYDVISVGELVGRDSDEHSDSIPGSLRPEAFSGEHFSSVRCE